MKIIELDKKKGYIKLLLESPDDLYVLFHFIRPGDLVRAKTTRKIKLESSVDRIPMELLISVTKVSFHEFSERLRITGTIVEGPEQFVSLGSHHTLNIQVGDTIEITRPKGLSDADLAPILEAEERSRAGNIILVAIEEGEATVGLLTPYGLRIFATVSKNVVKGDEYEASLRSFFSDVLDVVRNLRNQSKPTAIIIAGPGFAKEKFAQYLRDKLKDVPPIIVDSVTSGTEAGIHEILRRGLPEKIVQNQRVSMESRLVEEFLYHVARKDNLAVYGLDYVERAVEWGIASKLLVSMALLNTLDSALRSRILKLIDKAKKSGVDVILISTMHPSGKQFADLGGIAALLKYPIRIDEVDDYD